SRKTAAPGRKPSRGTPTRGRPASSSRSIHVSWTSCAGPARRTTAPISRWPRADPPAVPDRSGSRVTPPAGDGDRRGEHAPCLGCGCACDDVTVVVRDHRIVEARAACPLGVRWFQGTWPGAARLGDQPATVDTALDEIARLLRQARGGPLVYVAPGLP